MCVCVRVCVCMCAWNSGLTQVVHLSCDILSYIQTPHCAHMRTGYKYGNVTMVDTLLKDCLVDPFHDCHMGNTGMTVLLVKYI